MQKKISFAVIGCGRIGRRHAAMIQQNQEAELIALIENDERIHEDLEVEFPLAIFSSLEQMYLSGIRADVINICTPNYLHADHALQALELGSHLVIEKPMALHTDDARKVIERARKKNKKIFCVMQNRFSPPSRWLKSTVESGILGKIYMVQINCFWNRDQGYYKFGDPDYWKGKLGKDGGTLFTQFSHFVDTLYWVFGDIENIQAKFNNFNHQGIIEFEDSGMVNFELKGGGLGSITYSTSVWDKNMESSLTLIAEKGSVKIGGQYMNTLSYCHIENYIMPELEKTLPPNNYGVYEGSASNHQFVIQNVIETLKGNNSATTNAMEGLKVVEIIENIYKLKKN